MTDEFLSALRLCCTDDAAFERAKDLIDDEFSQAEIFAAERNQMMKRYALTLERMPVGYVMYAPDLTMAYINPAAEKMFGFAKEELIGKSPYDTIIPDFEADHLRGIERQISQGSFEAHSVNQNLTKDGRLIWCEWRNTPLLSEQNEVIGILSMAQDITDLKEAGDKILQSEAELHWLLNAIPFAICIYKAKESVFCNHTFLQSRGLKNLDQMREAKRENSAGNTQYALVHPDDDAAFFADFPEHQRRIEAGETVQCERRIRRFGSEDYVWHQCYIFKGIYPDGSMVVVEIDEPIEDRKRAELALRESEERFRAFMNQSPAAAWITDTDGKVDYVSQTYRKMFRVSGDMIGQHIQDLFPPLIAQQYLENTMQVARTGIPLETLEPGIRADGSAGEFLVYKFPLPRPDGRTNVGGVAIDITERKRVELALKESEERYRQIVETQRDFVLVSEPDTTITFANETLCRTLGLPIDQVVGQRWIQFSLPEDWNAIYSSIAALTPEQPTFFSENRDKRANGEIGWTQWINQGVFDDGGKLIKLQSVGRDITTLKKVEAEVRRTENMYRQILDAMTDGILVKGDGSKIIWGNKSFREFYGMTEAELQGLTDAPFNSPDFTQQYIRDDDHVFKTGNTLVIEEEQSTRHDGTVLSFNTVKSAIRDADGAVVMTVGVARDITERKRVELALKESEERFRALVENASDITVVLDTGGTFRYITEAANRILGYLPEDVVGRHATEFVHPGDVAVIVQTIQSLVANPEKSIEHVVFRTRHKDSTWRVFEATANNLLHNSAVSGLVVNCRDITERRAQGEEVRRSQQRLMQVLESTTDGYFILDKDRRFVFVNSAFEHLIRVRREDVLRQNIWDIFEPASLMKSYECYEKVLSERVPCEFQEYYPPLDLWLDIYAYPSDEGGLTAYFRDITAEKEREHQLLANQDFLQSIYYGIGAAVFVIDVEPGNVFRIMGLNPMHEKSIGIPKEAVVGKTLDALREFMPPETAERIYNTYMRCVTKGEAIEYEESAVINGREVYALTRLNPLFNSAMQVYRLIGTSIDITERKAAEERLKKSQSMLAETERLAHIGSWEFDVTSRKITWSTEVFRIYEREFARGEPALEEFTNMMKPEDRQPFELLLHRALTEGVGYERESRILTASGGEKRVCIVGKLLMDNAGKIEKLYGTVQDTTEAVKAKAEKEAMYQQLLQSQKMESLGVLASGVAHEFNNILTAIMGNATLLKKEFAPETKPATRLSQIEDISKRAAGIVKQMLGFARQGKSEVRRISLSACVQAVLQMLEPTIDKRILISVDTEPNVPSINGDEGQLEQVLLNLAVNAYDAMLTTLSDARPSGRLGFRVGYGAMPESLAVRYAVKENQAMVHLSVSDTGGGIAKEIREKIFEPFFTTKEVGKGTGLGLAMVYGIVRNHNGYIWLESEVGKGTTFHLFFPAPEKSAEALSTQAVSMPRPQTAAHVLAIDDEPSIRDLLVEILESEGYTVQTAANGKEGLALFAAQPELFEVVLLDMNLPELSGAEVLRQMRRIRPSVKVIVATGYLGNSAANDLARAGAFSILNKPFDVQALLDAVSAAVEM